MRACAAPEDGFFLRAESFFTLGARSRRLGVIDSYGGRSLHEQSHGESFLALANHRFGRDGLYLLDEPEAALSPQGQLALLQLIHDLVAEASQLVIATHSPILIGLPGRRAFYELSPGRALQRVRLTTRAETVELYRSFLAAPDVYLHYLGRDSD